MTNIFCQRNQEKCSKSRLVTTSAIKHFIAKVAYFYPKSGVVLGASIYVKPLPNRHSRASSPTRSLSKGKGVQKRINISRTSYLAPSIITNQKNYQSWKKIHGRRLYRWWYLYWRQHWLHWERHRVWVTDRYTSKESSLDRVVGAWTALKVLSLKKSYLWLRRRYYRSTKRRILFLLALIPEPLRLKSPGSKIKPIK